MARSKVAERHVLGTSALLASLLEEPGQDVARSAITRGETAMSAVDLAEVAGKLSFLGVAGKQVLRGVPRLGVEVVDSDRAQALEAGELQPVLHRRNIPLGDRACLASARTRNWPALTADRPWASLDIGVEVRLIR